MKKILCLLIILFITNSIEASLLPRFSTAGFYPLAGTGRLAYSMNVAWRFTKGDVPNAFAPDFDDSKWPVVSLPHGIEYLPVDASGGINYQGTVWYRKHFTPDDSLLGKKLFLHFEAIMGKSKVWINGVQVTGHWGGYLPVIADISNYIKFGEDNVIAVLADNSNDPLYAPGKAQNVLDYCYFGGIYRDCWLVAHNKVFITDPNYENEIAGGGQVVVFEKVAEQHATILLKTHIRNDDSKRFSGSVVSELLNKDGNIVARSSSKTGVKNGFASTIEMKIDVKEPKLWSPESPYLYRLNTRVLNEKGEVIDGYTRRIGIRSIEFKQKDGFWLNGKPYPKAIVGANRHQDFAIVGNALPNSIHWLDAKKLRDAGLKVIRNGNYPQDPAFMDACEELGLFILDNIPGWQFWNDNPTFGDRVYSDIRNMIRRDRNSPSILMWEPILNETYYPKEFAKKAHEITFQEFPYPNSISACDDGAEGGEYFSLLLRPKKTLQPDKTYFVREWGDNVDDWNAQNSNSRVNRSWGEVPMLEQAVHYARPAYNVICLDSLFKAPRQIVGGCLWHSFDHQRGYHPDPFYGGIMDAFRQPKYSYYMFQAQRDPEKIDIIAETGPMVYIAHEMTPFSPKDVTVYSNCDEVRLTFLEGGQQKVYKKDLTRTGMPSPVITFNDMYDFMTCKWKARANKQAQVYLLAEGLIGGKVVATHKVSPARRPEKLTLTVDNEEMELVADGSDFVTVVASLTDVDGVVKRLTNASVQFSVEGEGRILGGAGIQANPCRLLWGNAPVLIQSTTTSGKIKITAQILFEGETTPLKGEIVINSVKNQVPAIFSTKEAEFIKLNAEDSGLKKNQNPAADDEVLKLRRELNEYKLKEVENQQSKFGIGIN